MQTVKSTFLPVYSQKSEWHYNESKIYMYLLTSRILQRGMNSNDWGTETLCRKKKNTIRFWELALRAGPVKARATGLRDIKNNPLTSSEAWASRPDEAGGLDTSVQKCSCNCLDACGLLCSPWKPPKAGATRASRGRWSWCCEDAPPLIHCHASWSFYTWSACSGTIFSPRGENTIIVTMASYQHRYMKKIMT